MSYDYGFAGGRGGGGAAPAGGGGATRAPSGGGGGGGVRITPSGGGGGATTTARPQKTEVLNHVQQSAIGGPGAAAPAPSGVIPGGHPGLPGGGQGPSLHPNIGEHVGQREGQFRPTSQRDERGHPDQFRNFDHRFDQDRDRLGNNYWRIALTDYEIDRFRPYLLEDPYLYSIFGVNYYPELVAQYPIPYYPTTCGPFNTGIWVIGADSRWWPIHHHHLRSIRQIEALRGIGRYEPVIIPNCGIGGGLYPAAPVPTLYPAVAPSYPYLV